MIIICEPQCKGISHAQVNAGFLHGVKLAYPREDVLFFADKSHFDELNQDVKHAPITFNVGRIYSLRGIWEYFFLIKKIFDTTLKYGENKILFLSGGPIVLYVVKKLKQWPRYTNMCCTFVLHGELEDIANKDFKEPYASNIKSNFDIFNHPGVILLIIKNIIKYPFTFFYNKYSLIFKKYFRTKKMMVWRHSNRYKYVSLSPHVTKNASKFLNTKHLNFQTIILPIVFNKLPVTPKNKFVKFAVFGYGDSSQMHKLLTLLSKRKIKNNYEIKIISMDSRGTEGFSHVTKFGNGSVLTRKQMEDASVDVDMFINLYDKTRHRFGCSLSILESFLYLKPVLHLSNDGYNYFNKKNKPIGYRCENMETFVNKMVDIVDNYSSYQKDLNRFRKNMVEYRHEYDIKNNLDKLRECFTYATN